MKTEKLKWILVKSLDELKPGLTVKCTKCTLCSATHVMILIRLSDMSIGRGHSGAGVYIGRFWEVAIAPHAEYPEFNVAAAFNDRSLYRLDTGVDDALEQEMGRLWNAKPGVPFTVSQRVLDELIKEGKTK